MSTEGATDLIAQLSRSLCFGRVRGESIYISMAVTYPNGVGVAVRLDADGRDTFTVSDDGYAALIAETMRAVSNFRRIASSIAKRCGIGFDQGTFFVASVDKGALANAISAVANASARAMERVVASLEQPRVRRSRELFDRKLTDAFGDSVRFDVSTKGATGRQYDFSAGIERNGVITRIFELVFPTTQAVALANMKISDTLAAGDAPSITAALADYDNTDPTLRSILSAAGGSVIAANDDVATFRLAS